MEFAFKYIGIQYNCSRFASSQCLLVPPVTPHVRKRWKRNIQVNGKRNSARGPYVSFLESRNAQGGTFIVSWKRNTRKIRVCFLRFHFSLFFDFDPTPGAVELELIQTQMAQKPMLRAEVGMRVRCANKASAE